MAYQKRSKFVAIALAMFGGWFGAHKFYLKDISGGIFYIFLLYVTSMFLFPLTLALGFFEAFRLMFMPQDTFDRKYNNIPQNSPYRKRKTSLRKQEVPRVERSVQRTKRHNPFVKSGDRLYKEYALEEAASDYAKALEIDPNNKKVLFNTACVNSLLENKSESLNALNRLVALGFSDFEKIENFDDLAFIRIQPEYEGFRANGYKLSGQIKEDKKVKQEDDLVLDDLLLRQLNKLVELRKKGLLSDNEFTVEREKLMRR